MMGKPRNSESHFIIPHIPEGTVGAEIGVWMGHTAESIIKKKKPAHLHLVDPWSVEPYKQQVKNEHRSYENYLAKYSKVTGSSTEEGFAAHYDKVHASVVKRLGSMHNVTIHRKWSKDFFDTFEDKLDWIYIDGDHTYEGCYADLTGCMKIMKPGSFIFGDDYPWAKTKGKPGVLQAVDQFIQETGFEITKLGNREYKIKVS